MDNNVTETVSFHLSKEHLLSSPKIRHIVLQHDIWCARLKKTGDCNCNPHVRVLKEEEKCLIH